MLTPAMPSIFEKLESDDRRRVTIEKVDIYSARYPMTGYFKFFTGPHGKQGRAAVFVKLTASDGRVRGSEPLAVPAE